MKKRLTKIVAYVLTILTVMTIFSATVSAKAETITVNFACSDTEVIMPCQTLSVRDGLAEEYGFSVSEKDHNGVTVETATFFDAIIAAHVVFYGDLFTKETAKDYVDISYGYLTKAFGKSASMSGFIINKVVPNDGIIGKYGTFTGYSADTAQLKDGDNITFYFYQDTEMWSDWTAWFDKNSYATTVDSSFSINLKGYSATWYGFNSIETIESTYASIIPNADIYIYSENSEPVLVGTTDENGVAEIEFDKSGNYTLYAKGVIDGEYGKSPLIYPWCTVEVTEIAEEPQELTLWQKIVNFFVDVYNKISGFFRDVFNDIFASC